MVIYYSRAETGQGHAHMNFGSSGQGEIRINFWHSHSTENQQSGARIRPTGVLMVTDSQQTICFEVHGRRRLIHHHDCAARQQFRPKYQHVWDPD